VDQGTGTKVPGTIVPIRYNDRLGDRYGVGDSQHGGSRSIAPADIVDEYDRRHLSLYAELLDADDADHDWRHAMATFMRVDLADAEVEACWRSHLDQARWIVGDGLATVSCYLW